MADKDIYSIKLADPLAEIWGFAKERQSIYLKKSRGEPRPWTADPIMSQYKIGNIYREQDSTTVRILDWLRPLAEDPRTLWRNCLFARFTNKPETLAAVGYVCGEAGYVPEYYVERTLAVKPYIRQAYQIPAHFKDKHKLNTVADYIFRFLVPNSDRLFYAMESSSFQIVKSCERMNEINGYGNDFIFTQCMLDFGALRPDLLDRHQPVPIGPGAIPTLRWLGVKDFDELRETQKRYWPEEPTLDYASIDNMLCEGRKYLKMKHGFRKINNGLVYKEK